MESRSVTIPLPTTFAEPVTEFFVISRLPMFLSISKYPSYPSGEKLPWRFDGTVFLNPVDDIYGVYDICLLHCWQKGPSAVI